MKKERIEKEPVQIPDDVTVEILRRVPVKSLLRFGCACKTWYSVVSDPEFCNKLHHKRASVLIFKRYNRFVTIESLLKNEKTPTRSIPLSSPPERRFGRRLLGSCNGLVCVESANYKNPERGVVGLSFWNPSTRKLKELPSPTRVRNWCDQNTGHGFCYDGWADDYKFVWMVIKRGLLHRMIEFDVFSLKSNTWSSFDHCTSSEITIPSMSRFDLNLSGVLSNGAVHWVVHHTDQSGNSYRILAFDLTSNNYRLLETPLEFAKFELSLSGCPRLCIHYTDVRDWAHLWMMKDYRVDSSWLKLVSFPTNHFTLCSFGFPKFYPIMNEEGNIVAIVEYFSRNCREQVRLKVEKGALVSSQTLSSVFMDDEICVLEESLVSLN